MTSHQLDIFDVLADQSTPAPQSIPVIAKVSKSKSVKPTTGLCESCGAKPGSCPLSCPRAAKLHRLFAASDRLKVIHCGMCTALKRSISNGAFEDTMAKLLVDSSHDPGVAAKRIARQEYEAVDCLGRTYTGVAFDGLLWDGQRRELELISMDYAAVRGGALDPRLSIGTLYGWPLLMWTQVT